MKWSGDGTIREDEAPIKLAWPPDAPKMALFKGQHRNGSKRQVIAWYSLDQFLILVGILAPERLEEIGKRVEKEG